MEETRQEVAESIVLNTNHASDKAGRDAALAQRNADKKVGGVSTRKVLDCEMIGSENDVIRIFMSFDKDKALEWAKSKIDGLKEGMPAEGKDWGGVRFFYKEINSLR